MGSNKRVSQKAELELADGGRIARRETCFLPDGAYLFEDGLTVTGALTAKVIMCAAWLVEFYELRAGALFLHHGETRVRPRTRRFGVFYPPFTISQVSFEDARGRVVGVAGLSAPPAEASAVPVLFETNAVARPTGAAEVFERLRMGEERQTVELFPSPSLLSLRAKRLIDEHYLIHPSIARISARLGVTHEHLSRQFKRDYGMSPSAYLRQLRVADAPLRLARGEGIVNVSQEVGYNDLSRFYKQFRQTTKTSPGVCQTLLKPGRARPTRRN